MDKNLEKAKETIKNGGFTCVLTNGEKNHTSALRGVKPLLAWFESGEDFSGFSAADKVVGKAAAFLYVLLNVKEVFAFVISQPALEVLEQNKISVSYEVKVPAIRNRTNTGFCPMEAATRDVIKAEDSVAAIKQALKDLSEK